MSLTFFLRSEKMETDENQLVPFTSAGSLAPSGFSQGNEVASLSAGVLAAPGLAGEPPAFGPQTVATLELFRFMSVNGERVEAMRAFRRACLPISSYLLPNRS